MKIDEAVLRVHQLHPLENLPIEQVLPGGLGWLFSKCCCAKKLANKQQVNIKLMRKETLKGYQKLVMH